MTNKEAISILESLASIAGGNKNHYIFSDEDTERAIDMAIDALEEKERRDANVRDNKN